MTPGTDPGFLKRHSRTVRLPDGASILVRPVGVNDRDIIAAGFSRLSEQSRRRRFLRPVTRLTEADLYYLTELDYVHHFAWGALTTGEPATGIGVARLVRDEDSPETAEAAVVVADEWQGRSVGTVLADLLGLTAERLGVSRLRAVVASSNEPARRFFGRLGAHGHHAGGLWTGLLDIPIAASPLRGTPIYDELVAAAAGNPGRREAAPPDG